MKKTVVLFTVFIFMIISSFAVRSYVKVELPKAEQVTPVKAEQTTPVKDAQGVCELKNMFIKYLQTASC